MLNREKQLNGNIFNRKNTIKKSSNAPTKKPAGNKQNTSLLEPSIDDICDMMETVSECSEDSGSNDFNSSENIEIPVAVHRNLKDDANDIRNATERLENEYQMQISDLVNYVGETKELLPIKTKKGGIVSRSANVLTKSDQVDIKKSAKEAVPEQEIQTPQAVPPKPKFMTSDLLSEREDEIERQKFLIGVTCASILENPETKIKNLAVLVDLIPETSQSGKTNMYIIRKLAMISLVEVFKDIVPEYRLGIIDTTAQKCKY